MTKLMLGTLMALLPLSGSVAAECIYQGVAYSEGARVCMHRTMYMCRGERWVKTAERCWEQCFTRAARSRDAAYSCGLAELAVIQPTGHLANPEQEQSKSREGEEGSI